MHDHEQLTDHGLLPRPGPRPRLLRRRAGIPAEDRHLDGEGYRWVTVVHPNQPELEVTLMTPGPPLDEEGAGFVRRQLEKGQMGGLGLRVDDCRKTHQEFVEKGVTFLQEPADRPYGVEAVMRDNSGCWLVLVEPKEFAPSDFD